MVRLSDVPRGVMARVVDIRPARRCTLAAHGIRPGARLQVDGDAPFGGPRIVRLGRARLAVSRVVAADVSVVVDAEPVEERAW